MKFKIDLDTNNGFIQIFGITEFGCIGEVPIAFQVRGGHTFLSTLADTLQKVLDSILIVEDQYHDNSKARRDFHEGMVVFAPGDVPITAIIKERLVTLVIGSRLFSTKPVKVEDLLEAVQLTLATAE